MTMQTLKGGQIQVPFLWLRNTAPAASNETLDANGEKYAFITQAGKSGEIAKILFRVGAMTTTGNLDVRLETVDAANGDPSGALKDVNSNATQNVLDSDDNTWFAVSLTASATVTKGDIIAAVLVADANFDGQILNWTNSIEGGFGYQDEFLTGSWVKTSSRGGMIGLEYDDGSYEFCPGMYPGVPSSLTFNNTSTPDHIGMIFQIPFPIRVTGISFILDTDGDVDIKLYDSDGTTVLETLSLDKDIRGSAGGTIQQFLFASTHLLAKDVNYRIVVEPTSATNVRIYFFDVNAVAVMDGFSGGQKFHYTTKKDAGWTETITRRPFFSLLCDQFDDGAGGGAGGAPLLINGGLISTK